MLALAIVALPVSAPELLAVHSAKMASAPSVISPGVRLTVTPAGVPMVVVQPPAGPIWMMPPWPRAPAQAAEERLAGEDGGAGGSGLGLSAAAVGGHDLAGVDRRRAENSDVGGLGPGFGCVGCGGAGDQEHRRAGDPEAGGQPGNASGERHGKGSPVCHQAAWATLWMV